MPGSIHPLPVMLEEEDRKVYENLQPPKTIVVRYGYMKLVAELGYDGDSTPGCGSKLVIRTDRGTELATMLTTTCSNSGCGSSVSRKQMLEYIENSGGKKYPFTTKGRVLRIATPEDLREQEAQDNRKRDMIRLAKGRMAELDLDMKLVDVEVLLGGERIIFHYTSEQWVDFRDLVKSLASEYQTRIEMHQVNDRDEARIVADYEKCGQYCCCKQFLKVLKPVSMRSAKVQKATLDPHKISGRCGRLMCCLRYEDETYEKLRKKLPHRQTRVMTDDGPGTVVDSQILTQLVLVSMDATRQRAAYAVESIRKLTKEEDQQFREEREAREAEARERAERRASRRGGQGGGQSGGASGGPKRGGKPGGDAPLGSTGANDNAGAASTATPEAGPSQGAAEQQTEGDRNAGDDTGEKKGRRRRRRRRGRGGGEGGEGSQGGESQARGESTDAGEPRRPQPGQPLADHEVESKEGHRSDNPQAPSSGDGGPSGAQAGGDTGGHSDGDAGDGQGPRKKKRRRRRGGRRRGGKGGEGGPQAGGPSSGDGGPPSGGGGGGGGGDGAS